jgi:hypothetical protein
LTRDEKEYVDKYHAECFKRLSPLMKEDEQSELKKMCAPLRSS